MLGLCKNLAPGHSWTPHPRQHFTDQARSRALERADGERSGSPRDARTRRWRPRFEDRHPLPWQFVVAASPCLDFRSGSGCACGTASPRAPRTPGLAHSWKGAQAALHIGLRPRTSRTTARSRSARGPAGRPLSQTGRGARAAAAWRRAGTAARRPAAHRPTALLCPHHQRRHHHCRRRHRKTAARDDLPIHPQRRAVMLPSRTGSV